LARRQAAARVTTIYQRARRQIYRLTAPSDQSAACTLAGVISSLGPAPGMRNGTSSWCRAIYPMMLSTIRIGIRTTAATAM
jgi:hypothetical protein